MHMSLLGTAPERTLLRSGARIGDALYVTGELGLSFESGRHLDFEPRIAEGEFLAQTWGVGACIDLSDGLASDVKNIIPRGACAESLGTSLSRIGRLSAPAGVSESGGLVVVRSGGGREVFRGSGFDHMA